LTLSNRCCMGLAALLNKREFRSFHMTQMQVSQISCRKDRCVRRPQLSKWTEQSTAENPIQERTRAHMELKVLQERNKCCADSMPPHPDTQKWTSEEMMPRALSLYYYYLLSIQIGFAWIKISINHKHKKRIFIKYICLKNRHSLLWMLWCVCESWLY
jgi:hypothetical protein